MTTDINTIVSDVYKVIDELIEDVDTFTSEEDVTALQTIIVSKIPESCDYIHLNADMALLRGDSITTISYTVNSDGKIPVAVSDLLRFVSGKCSAWNKAVTSLTAEGTPEYSIALDPYVGASVERPAALLAQYKTSKSITLIPTFKSNWAAVSYIAHCSIIYDEISIDSNLYPAFINYLGGLTLLVQNDDRGENLITLARNEIGINTSNVSE